MPAFTVSVPIEDWNRAAELSGLSDSPSKLVQFLLLRYIEEEEKEIEFRRTYSETH